MHTACVWSEKLPFAGYSVVKESAFALRASARQAHGPIFLTLSHDLTGLTACLVVGPTLVIGAKAGGEYRARTGDLLVANQALSQLS